MTASTSGVEYGQSVIRSLTIGLASCYKREILPFVLLINDNNETLYNKQ